MAAWQPKSTLARAVSAAGFLYDPTQDIIYSKIDAWQYGLGYCSPYDSSSAHLSMIIDCEPFYFTYGGKHWMIELWKGQYGIETGCEIGVYCDYTSATVHHKLSQRPGTAPASGLVNLPPSARFYRSVQPHDMLTMTSTLYRKGTKLFQRGPAVHWWLTGFKWGVFTRDTHELTMQVELDFPNEEMREAFRNAARAIGYHTRERGAFGIGLTFRAPHTTQPQSRRRLASAKQHHNKLGVEGYDLLKKALKLSTNDPNRFTLDRVEDEAGPVVSRAARHLPHGASAAARAAERRAVAAARRHHGEVSEEALTAYHQVLAFFEKKTWRTTHRPVAVA